MPKPNSSQPPQGIVAGKPVPPPAIEGLLAGPPGRGRGPKDADQPKVSTHTTHEPKDSVREIVETVVFVVVLVLLLKTFVAEAFVIPTGSMATTLLGYHKNVECPKCKFKFTVNC